MGPLQRYQRDLESGTICADEAQAELVRKLQNLHEQIVLNQASGNGPWAWLRQRVLGEEKAGDSIKGLYIWGGVGRGKTYLMDLFFESLPGEAKMRTHFHRFMHRVHNDLAALQGQKNPLQQVADKIADQARVLCFDEFFVRDIGDAMILAGLLDALFERRVTLVTTSNIAPDRLYEDGLQRQRFLPAIELIKKHTMTVAVANGVDYRLRSLSQATLYHCPITRATEPKLLQCFHELAPERSKILEKAEIEILERRIATRYCSKDVVWFDFEQICEGARSAFDYVELARIYHAVILGAVPQMREQANDSARRFISLVDELYDRRVKLIIAAEVPIAQLYTGDKLRFEFERTQSRLIEMQSQDYLSDQHLA
ncbi:MAG: cell division protein ZapE [Pseudohongiellaceae bacterium]